MTQVTEELTANIYALGEEICKFAEDKGWNEDNRTFPEWVALFHSELSEALEEFNRLMPYGEITFIEDDFEELEPRGIPIELADLLIRVLHFSQLHGVDLPEALKIRMEYNKTLPMKYVSAKI